MQMQCQNTKSWCIHAVIMNWKTLLIFITITLSYQYFNILLHETDSKGSIPPQMSELISHHDSCLTREVSSDQDIINNHEYLEAQTLMLRSETHQQNREKLPCHGSFWLMTDHPHTGCKTMVLHWWDIGLYLNNTFQIINKKKHRPYNCVFSRMD